MLSCEDDIADTIRPRLEAVGADLAKVHILQAVRDKRGERRLFSAKQDIARLEEAIDQVVATIRRMEAAGDLFLIVKEEGEEEETEAPAGAGAASSDQHAG